MKMSIPTSFWFYCSYAPNWNVGKVDCALEKRVKLPQQSNAACVHNMSRFNGGKLPGNSEHFSKSEKIKQFLEREALNVAYLWKSSRLFTYDFIASYFVLSLYF